jgi:D-alanyl-D-alanine carboxypeptidase
MGGWGRAAGMIAAVAIISSCAGAEDSTAIPAESEVSDGSRASGLPVETTGGRLRLEDVLAAEGGFVLASVADPTFSVSAASGGSADEAFLGASLSKLIVATTVMQLVDEGAIGLDDSIGDYLGIEAVDGLTVRALLGHRSGIPSMTDQLERCPDPTTIDRAIALAQDTNLVPGELDYSNTNYLILGEIVHVASGVDVAERARSGILDPLGMTSTYWWETQDGPAPRADGVIRPGACDTSLEQTVGTEGLTFVTSLADMQVFLPALLEGSLVSGTSLEAMLPAGDEPGGLGLWSESDDERGATIVGGLGGRDSFTAWAMYDIDRGRMIVAYAESPAEAEAVVWAAWDWAEAQAGG